MPGFLPHAIQFDAEPRQTQENFIRSFPRFVFVSLSRHVWTNDHMLKDCSRVTFPVMLDMALYLFLTKKVVALSIGYRDFSPTNAENV
jgi:hypothetical protein